jgi:hypothetical protein
MSALRYPTDDTAKIEVRRKLDAVRAGSGVTLGDFLMPRKASPSAPAGTKWCHGCSGAPPFGAFSTDQRNADGCTSRCRGCVERQRQERAECRAVVKAAAARMMSR